MLLNFAKKVIERDQRFYSNCKTTFFFEVVIKIWDLEEIVIPPPLSCHIFGCRQQSRARVLALHQANALKSPSKLIWGSQEPTCRSQCAPKSAGFNLAIFSSFSLKIVHIFFVVPSLPTSSWRGQSFRECWWALARSRPCSFLPSQTALLFHHLNFINLF